MLSAFLLHINCGLLLGRRQGKFWGGNPNLLTKKTSFNPNFPIKKAFLALMVHCKIADKLNIYNKLAEKPNVWVCRILLWLRPWSPKLRAEIFFPLVQLHDW